MASPPTTMPSMRGMANMPGMGGGQGSSAATKRGGVSAHGPVVHHATVPVAHHMAGMAGMWAAPPIDAHTVVTHWQISPFPAAVAVVLVAFAVWYVAAVRRLAVKGRRWSPWRTRIAAGQGMTPPVFTGRGLASTFKAIRGG